MNSVNELNQPPYVIIHIMIFVVVVTFIPLFLYLLMCELHNNNSQGKYNQNRPSLSPCKVIFDFPIDFISLIVVSMCDTLVEIKWIYFF